MGLVLSVLSTGCNERLQGNWSADPDRVASIRKGLGSGVETASNSSATAEQPTGWATLTGSFKVTGDAPRPPALNVDKDMEVCAPSGQTVLSDSIVVGAGGALKNAVIYLTSKISDTEPWTHPDAQPVDPANSEEVVFDQKECIFLTHVVAVKSGQKLKILNSDPVGHNTNILASPPFNQTIPSSGSAVYQTAGEESQPASVKCSIHPWMSAYLLTRKNGYFAVSDADGKFTIPNLPAGVELEFRVWQEVAKIDQVTVNGKAEKWSKGKFTLRLDPTDAAKNSLEIAIDAAAFK